MPENNGLEYRQAEAAEATAGAQGNWPNLETGQDTVATAGTAVQLNGGTSLVVPDGASVSVTALPSNAGNIYVGDSTVDSATGDVLTADTSVSPPVTDVASIYIDADNAGEGVSWITEVDT